MLPAASADGTTLHAQSSGPAAAAAQVAPAHTSSVGTDQPPPAETESAAADSMAAPGTSTGTELQQPSEGEPVSAPAVPADPPGLVEPEAQLHDQAPAPISTGHDPALPPQGSPAGHAHPTSNGDMLPPGFSAAADSGSPAAPDSPFAAGRSMQGSPLAAAGSPRAAPAGLPRQVRPRCSRWCTQDHWITELLKPLCRPWMVSAASLWPSRPCGQ